MLKQLDCLEARDLIVNAADRALEFCMSDEVGRLVTLGDGENTERHAIPPIEGVDDAWRREMLQYVQYAVYALAVWLSCKFDGAGVKLSERLTIKHLPRGKR